MPARKRQELVKKSVVTHRKKADFRVDDIHNRKGNNLEGPWRGDKSHLF